MKQLLSMESFRRIKRDVYGGLLMIAFGGASIQAGIRYEPGSLQKMGSGFFPIMLGVALVLIGFFIMLGARKAEVEIEARSGESPQIHVWDESAASKSPASEARNFDGRSWIFIIASLLAFVWVGKYGGLLPATFLIVFLSALGDRSNTLKSALVLSTIMCFIAVVVFWWALKMQFPLFGWGAMQ